MSQVEYPSYQADDAITSKTMDRLGYGGFVCRIADAILEVRSTGAYVIGLEGPWGCGKSSLMNLLKEELRERETEQDILMLDYCPWLRPKADHVYEYHRTISLALRQSACGDDTLAQLFEDYANSARQLDLQLRKAESIVSVASSALAILTVALIGWGYSSLAIVSSVLTAVGAILRSSRELLQSLVTDHEASASAPALQAMKNGLRSRLQAGSRKLVVFVDDLDRLPPSTVNDLLQIVKNNCDLPNVVHILAYDRETMNSLLFKLYPTSRHTSFMDKIVQLQASVPRRPGPANLEFLRKPLNELMSSLEDAQIESLWDKDRWRKLALGYLFYIIETPRDAKRIFDLVFLAFRQLSHNNKIDVNPIDLVFLESLRAKFPSVYRSVFDRSIYFVSDSKPPVWDRSMKASAVKDFVDSCLEDATQDAHIRDAIAAGLQVCFHRVSLAFEAQEFGYGGDDETLSDSPDSSWWAEKRVCHPRVFDRYFLFSHTEADLSEEQLGLIRSTDPNTDAFNDLVKEYSDGRRFGVLVRRFALELDHAEVSRNDGHRYLSLLINASDGLWAEGDDGIGSSLQSSFVHAVSKSIRRAQLSDDDLAVLLKQSRSLVGAVSFVDNEMAPQGSARTAVLSSALLERLKCHFTDKVQGWLSVSDNVQHPGFAFMLSMHRKWNESSYSEWVRATLRPLLSDENYLHYFLARFTRTVYPKRDEPEYSADNLDFFVGRDILLPLLKNHKRSQSEPYKTLINELEREQSPPSSQLQ